VRRVGQVCEDHRACPVRGKLTRRHPRDHPRAKVGEDVRVGVRVRVGAVECQLKEYGRTSLFILLVLNVPAIGPCRLPDATVFKSCILFYYRPP